MAAVCSKGAVGRGPGRREVEGSGEGGEEGEEEGGAGKEDRRFTTLSVGCFKGEEDEDIGMNPS
jgi:hypothetical protein